MFGNEYAHVQETKTKKVKENKKKDPKARIKYEMDISTPDGKYQKGDYHSI